MKTKVIVDTVNILAVLIVTLAFHVEATERVYVYPNAKQSERQLAQDRYECHRWAVTETGFNPLDEQISVPQQPVRVPVADNPAEGATAKGALAGAVIGAAIGAADDHHTGEGAAIGAIVGAITGSVVEDRGYKKVRSEAEQAAQREAGLRVAERERIQSGRTAYRRAVAACLGGRGYRVK